MWSTCTGCHFSKQRFWYSNISVQTMTLLSMLSQYICLTKWCLSTWFSIVCFCDSTQSFVSTLLLVHTCYSTFLSQAHLGTIKYSTTPFLCQWSVPVTLFWTCWTCVNSYSSLFYYVVGDYFFYTFFFLHPYKCPHQSIVCVIFPSQKCSPLKVFELESPKVIAWTQIWFSLFCRVG